MGRVNESKILASKILMLNKENKKTVLNVLDAFIVSETASKLGVSPSKLSNIMQLEVSNETI